MVAPPWIFEPTMTRDRIEYVAALIYTGRKSALTAFDPTEGDDNWTLGCQAYKRECHQITMASLNEAKDWLSVLDPGMAFTFRIGSIPARLFHGEPEDPHEKRLYLNAVELAQLSLGFEDSRTGPGLIWRFVCKTNVLGECVSIVAVGYNEVGTVVSFHEVFPSELPVVFRRSPESEEYADTSWDLQVESKADTVPMKMYDDLDE